MSDTEGSPRVYKGHVSLFKVGLFSFLRDYRSSQVVTLVLGVLTYLDVVTTPRDGPRNSGTTISSEPLTTEQIKMKNVTMIRELTLCKRCPLKSNRCSSDKDYSPITSEISRPLWDHHIDPITRPNPPLRTTERLKDTLK